MKNDPIGRFLTTIILGGQPNANGYCQDLRTGDFRITKHAFDLILAPTFTVSATALAVDLFVVPSTELELRFPTDTEVYEAGQLRGLQLCPPEVGPALRLAYPDQPEYEYLYLAMSPIVASDGHPAVFGVCRGRLQPSLATYWASPDTTRGFEPISWLFVRPSP